jgi:hypothetical protein
MSEELKACPFCGCSVRLVERKNRDELISWGTWYHIEGSHEGIGGVCPGQIRARGSAETAITAWNTRAPDSALAAAQAKVARLREALEPSCDTKAAYMGEFAFTLMSYDEDGEEMPRKVYVPWDTVKQIMAAIAARAALVQP